MKSSLPAPPLLRESDFKALNVIPLGRFDITLRVSISRIGGCDGVSSWNQFFTFSERYRKEATRFHSMKDRCDLIFFSG